MPCRCARIPSFTDHRKPRQTWPSGRSKETTCKALCDLQLPHRARCLNYRPIQPAPSAAYPAPASPIGSLSCAGQPHRQPILRRHSPSSPCATRRLSSLPPLTILSARLSSSIEQPLLDVTASQRSSPVLTPFCRSCLAVTSQSSTPMNPQSPPPRAQDRVSTRYTKFGTSPRGSVRATPRSRRRMTTVRASARSSFSASPSPSTPPSLRT